MMFVTAAEWQQSRCPLNNGRTCGLTGQLDEGAALMREGAPTAVEGRVMFPQSLKSERAEGSTGAADDIV